MEPYVPLIQTGLWIAAFIGVAWIFRREIGSLQRAMHERLQAGAAVKLAWLELGEVRTEVHTMREQIDGMSQQVTALFLATMSPSMYLNLRKLESGRFGRFEALRRADTGAAAPPRPRLCRGQRDQTATGHRR